MQPTGNLVADTICRTAEIGLTITGAADAGSITIIDAAPVAVSDACPECSRPGTKRDHIFRRLVDLPVVGFPTRLHVRVPRGSPAAIQPAAGSSSRPEPRKVDTGISSRCDSQCS